ncbi:DgyrCDS11433 [Dimorphilus gyrociliatus]|uniref:Alpha-galactosidase n=1 Tax=Dimorphilus gyrociliatus TaxID=2664684 RepID=A0A7I8W5V3_9ANNE|nr:DgyrCDS11433 [Dimorphilus gyrociliatus]
MAFYSAGRRKERCHCANVTAYINGDMKVRKLGGKYDERVQVAPTPPMGWNSWNYFSCEGLNEQVVKEVIEAFVHKGLREAGYSYIPRVSSKLVHFPITDCWQINRTAEGIIIPDPHKFPGSRRSQSLDYLSLYAHGKALKFGLYTDTGYRTCQGRPGSFGYERKDAETYAKWNIDYLKNDDCNLSNETTCETYKAMFEAISSTSRPIVHSVKASCGPEMASAVSNMRRVGQDIRDNWESVLGLIDIYNRDELWRYSRPGFWNDLDMLEVGNGGMTMDQYVGHFGLWCVFKAPLILGNDIRYMTSEVKNLITHDELIAINQDRSEAARLVWRSENGMQEIYTGPLSDKRRVALLLNRGNTSANIQLDWGMLPDVTEDTSLKVRDAYRRQNLGSYTNHIKETVKPTSAKILVLIL